MMQKIKQLISEGTDQSIGKLRRLRFLAIIIVIIGAVGIAGFYIKKSGSSKNDNLNQEREIPAVEVKALGDLVSGATIEKLATIEPAVGAPLVARTGGRVTGINMNLGETVRAGETIVNVDSGIEANPARAQVEMLQSSLAVLNDIEKEAIKAADNAIRTAQLSVDAASAGKTLTIAQVKKSNEQAEIAVRQAELAYEDAINAEKRVDQVVRATDIGLKMARIGQDQAVIAKQLANQQTSDGVKQAKLGLEAVKQARDKIVVDIQSQRVGLQGQMLAAAEQVKMAQVISPVNGQITRLTVRKGDFVRPGQEVGEIIAFEGAKIRMDVNTGIREKLVIGQKVTIKARGQEFTGEVVRLADGPRSDMALWQIDIFVSGTPEVVHPGDLVTVVFPVGVVEEGALFIPLDVVVVRQDGIMLMTVDGSGLVSEHAVRPISYSGDYIEAIVDVSDDAMVVVGGNRTLRAGDLVRFDS